MLVTAIAHHRAGRLAQAEQLYRKLLETQPRNPDANHNLGTLAIQAGKPHLALRYFRVAAESAPTQALFWQSYIGSLLGAGHIEDARKALADGRKSGLSGSAADGLSERLIATEKSRAQFATAVAHHQAGHLNEAAAGYRAALSLKPDYAEAASNLGFALLALGQPAEAEESCRRALEINPQFSDAANNLGNALSALGRLDEAAESFRRASALRPDNANALFNLGNTLKTLGRLDEAIACYRRAIDTHPAFVEACMTLAGICLEVGRLDEAETAYLLAIEQAPELAQAHVGLGNARIHLRRLKDAESSLRRAIEIDPNSPAAHGNLGAIFCETGRLDEAMACFRKCLEIDPDSAAAHSNLGAALYELGRLEESETSIRRALEIDPKLADAHFNLANSLHKFGRLQEAEACFRRAIAIKPDYVAAHNNFGNTLRDLGRLEEAVESYRRVLGIDPGHAMAQSNLGNSLRELGRLDEALVHLETAVRLKPDYLIGQKNLLTALTYHPSIDPARYFDAHRRFEAQLAEPLYRQIRPHANDPDPRRRLRIGYLSSDFRSHSAARNLLPLFQSRNRAEFELFLYAEVLRPDAMTEQFRAEADCWRSTVGLDDHAVADLIRGDGIDIFVCLAGRFDQNRPLVAAYRPAPVQISSHDVATSGLRVVDYLISDRTMTPRNTPERFVERVLCVPRFYLAEIPKNLPVVKARTSGSVVFGCLNNPSKISESVLDLWARLLALVPGSRLLLRYINWYDAPSARARVAAALQRHGVDPARADYPPSAASYLQHMETYNEIDVALDTFPFSGSTTTFDALVMGVPVVTLPGWTMVSRWSAGMLAGLKLDELIADSPENYISIAQQLAIDVDRRAQLRATLRTRVGNSQLCEPAARARQFERLYRAVWRRWCATAGGRSQ